MRCDVRDSDEVEAAFAAIEERWGPVEVLVANAGITMDSLMLRMSDQAFLDVIDANLTGSFRVAKRAVAKMLRLHAGRIIFVSSVGAFVGLPGQANYAASKAGLVGMARAIAREVGSRQITVNVVAPGLIDTDMTAALGRRPGGADDRAGAARDEPAAPEDVAGRGRLPGLRCRRLRDRRRGAGRRWAGHGPVACWGTDRQRSR